MCISCVAASMQWPVTLTSRGVYLVEVTLIMTELLQSFNDLAGISSYIFLSGVGFEGTYLYTNVCVDTLKKY